jgi:hypothetical protein
MLKRLLKKPVMKFCDFFCLDFPAKVHVYGWGFVPTSREWDIVVRSQRGRHLGSINEKGKIKYNLAYGQVITRREAIQRVKKRFKIKSQKQSREYRTRNKETIFFIDNIFNA